MALGLSRERGSAVSLEEGAGPGAKRCPACGEPLFVWVEARGWGLRSDEVIDRCENCGLVASREAVPEPDAAAALLRSERLRTPNAASLQAWLGAENWAALGPRTEQLKLTPRAAELLCERANTELERVRQPAAPAIASMWQTLLNLLTFHRNFAAEAASGRLRPSSGRGRAAFAVDAAITLLAGIPTAVLAVILEGAALAARRGGVIELTVRPGAHG